MSRPAVSRGRHGLGGCDRIGRCSERQRSGSVLCPSCGSLVGVGDDACLICGRKRPGLWGFAGPLRSLLEDDMGFGVRDPRPRGPAAPSTSRPSTTRPSRSIGNPSARRAGCPFLSPGVPSLFLFGASGALPVFGYGRWWTPLSAGWLHGGAAPHRLQHDGAPGPGTADRRISTARRAPSSSIRWPRWRGSWPAASSATTSHFLPGYSTAAAS